MITNRWIGYTVVFDDSPFNGNNPFNLKADLKSLGINEAQKLELKIKLEEELKKGGPRKDAFRHICGSIISVFAADVRCADEHGGKSSGYRVFLMVVPPLKKGFVLGVVRHKHKSKDTTLTDQAKKQLKKIVDAVENLTKGDQKGE